MATLYRIPRFLCPSVPKAVRTYARQSTDRRKSPLVQNIDKLEAYLKVLQKDVRKKAHKATIDQDAGTFDEQEMTELYQAIASPLRPALVAPKELLSRELCSKLSIDITAPTGTINWALVTDKILSTEVSANFSIPEINDVLHAMPHHDRVVSGRRLVENLTFRPTRFMYDLLMDSYASNRSVVEALEMFDRIKSANLEPSLYSYAHLMKAFAMTRDLPKASALYQHMQEQNIEPNLVINTSLIATCIRSQQVERAFSIFDSMKYKATTSAPDAQTYSMMIHACSLDLNMSAERASDLYQEMTERGLQPTLETFNSLIHVYASRKDYFTEAWRISESMQRNNIQMDKTTWHGLLSACVTNRDIGRARTLVRELFRLGGTQEAWQPDGITYQLLFRAYANASVKRSKNPQSRNLDVLNPSEDIVSHQPDGSLWVDEVPFTSDAVLQESFNVMRHLQSNRPDLLGTQLIDTYLTISQAFESPERFLNDWNTLYDDEKIPKGRFSYQIGLAASYTFKDWPLLQQVWSEREAWRSGPGKEAGDVGIRGVPRSKKVTKKDSFGDFEATKTYIESLARLNRVQQATRVLDSARNKFIFHKADLKCFQTKSLQVGDEEAVLLYMDMFPDHHTSRKDYRYY